MTRKQSPLLKEAIARTLRSPLRKPRHRWVVLKGDRPHADDSCRDCSAQRRDLPVPCWNKDGAHHG